MPTAPAAPALTEVAALAERALRALEGEGQAEVRWERRLDDAGTGDELVVTVTAVEDGRAGRATTSEDDEAHLTRAARAAVLRARQARAWPASPLPEPDAGSAHEGFDARLLDLDPARAVAEARAGAGAGLDVDWRAGLSRTATASSRGVRAAEERSHVVCRVRGERPGERHAAVTLAGTGAVDVARAAAEVRALLGEAQTTGRFGLHVPPGPAAHEPVLGAPGGDGIAVTVVLGPEAVAAVLDQLRAACGVDLALGGGPLAGRRGTRVAPAAVTLSDSARHPRTLPRSYDAEGVPRRPVELIRAGVAHGQVHDSASAARARARARADPDAGTGADADADAGASSTGHATRAATLAPYPDHLVLAGGDAEDVGALCAPVARGLFIPALSERFEPEERGRRHETVGAALIEDGRAVAALRPLVVAVGAPEVLAAVQALTGAQRVVALRGQAPGGIGAAVVPAMRAGAGVRVLG